MRMPIVLNNAPATFQKFMDCIVAGLQGNELFVYLEDIVIYAKTLKEHKVQFDKLMRKITEANLKLQPEKCKVLKTKVVYLSHDIRKADNPTLKRSKR